MSYEIAKNIEKNYVEINYSPDYTIQDSVKSRVAAIGLLAGTPTPHKILVNFQNVSIEFMPTLPELTKLLVNHDDQFKFRTYVAIVLSERDRLVNIFLSVHESSKPSSHLKEKTFTNLQTAQSWLQRAS